MNEISNKDCFVVPQWLPFRISALQREYHTFSNEARPASYHTRKSFRDSVENFRNAPSPFVGAELMGVARILGCDDVAHEIAEYVLCQLPAGPVAQEQARVILGKKEIPVIDEERAIGHLKARVRDFPNDAISYVDQARLYCILGQKKQANKSVMAALHLAGSDRFVVRSSMRFFMHEGDWDLALRYAQRAYEVNPDPLIYGPLLSAATFLNKIPKNTKRIGESAIKSENIFLHSEVLAALGVLEMRNGADKRSRRFLKRAWMDPTKAVIGHSQWILRRNGPLLSGSQAIDLHQSQEALAWLRYSLLDFRGALASSNAWALEEPFARDPHVLGSISACQCEDFDAAEKIAQTGLRANPKDETLLNNLAFAQLRNGKIASAEKILNQLSREGGDRDRVVPIATKGLLLMLKGELKEGIRQYELAIRRASEAGDSDLTLRAVLNLVISLIDAIGDVDSNIFESINKVLATTRDPSCLGAAQAIIRRLSVQKKGDRLILQFVANAERATLKYRKELEDRLSTMVIGSGQELF